MKWLIPLFFLLIGCNSQDAALTPISGIRNPADPVPYITSVSVPAPGVYEDANVLTFAVTFSEPVLVDSVPRLGFVTETGSYFATYSSGTGSDTLTFNFTIPAGVSDDNGITLSQVLTLNGGSIYDPDDDDDADLTYVSPPTWNILIDAITPYIASITPPSNGTYGGGQKLYFTLNYSHKVIVTGTPRLPINIGGLTYYANYESGSGSLFLTFSSTVLGVQMDTDGIDLTGAAVDLTLGGTIRDAFGDNALIAYSSVHYPAVLIDGPAVPDETGRTMPATMLHGIGDVLEFKIGFDEAVIVTGGTPHIEINIGGVTKTADFFPASSGTNELIFRYTVLEGDNDSDGLTVSSFAYNGAAIRDASNNSAVFSLPWPGNIARIDGIRPTAIVTIPQNNFSTGNTPSINVAWSEQININGASPKINFTMDSPAGTYSFVGSTGTLTNSDYYYTVASNNIDMSGINITGTIDLNSGTIQDDAGNDAVLTFAGGGVSKLCFVPVELQNWYDAGDTLTTGASTTNLTDFMDRHGPMDGILAGAPPYLGAQKAVQFTGGVETVYLGSHVLNYVLIVVNTEGGGPGIALSDGLTAPLVSLAAGIVSGGFNCSWGQCVYKDSASNWVPSGFGGELGNYSLASKRIIAVGYPNLPALGLYLSQNFNGRIYELMLFSGFDPQGAIDRVTPYLITKHGATL